MSAPSVDQTCEVYFKGRFVAKGTVESIDYYSEDGSPTDAYVVRMTNITRPNGPPIKWGEFTSRLYNFVCGGAGGRRRKSRKSRKSSTKTRRNGRK